MIEFLTGLVLDYRPRPTIRPTARKLGERKVGVPRKVRAGVAEGLESRAARVIDIWFSSIH